MLRSAFLRGIYSIPDQLFQLIFFFHQTNFSSLSLSKLPLPFAGVVDLLCLSTCLLLFTTEVCKYSELGILPEPFHALSTSQAEKPPLHSLPFPPTFHFHSTNTPKEIPNTLCSNHIKSFHHIKYVGANTGPIQPGNYSQLYVSNSLSFTLSILEIWLFYHWQITATLAFGTSLHIPLLPSFLFSHTLTQTLQHPSIPLQAFPA